ncbi:unnamed protein product [Trichogramma brassicae]|uniref:PPAF-2-like Clip domain-containing protein n=1 Tax=Trichogramma brassicae TaxID=86971 RepID=A0A6H5IG20_9HYME|nr:unnamed protein product [Trichogramma brassicae]
MFNATPIGMTHQQSYLFNPICYDFYRHPAATGGCKPTLDFANRTLNPRQLNNNHQHVQEKSEYLFSSIFGYPFNPSLSEEFDRLFQNSTSPTKSSNCANGDKAHTIKYCPINSNKHTQQLASMNALKALRNSCGRRRSPPKTPATILLLVASLLLASLDVASSSPLIVEDDISNSDHRSAESQQDRVTFEDSFEESSGLDYDHTDEPLGRTLLLLKLLKQKFHKLQQLQHIPTPSHSNFLGCICVPFYLCNANGTIINDGSGVIDYRHNNRKCNAASEVCCYLRATAAPPPTVPAPTIPTTTTTTTPKPTVTIPTTVATTTTTTTTTPRPAIVNLCYDVRQQIYVNPCFGTFYCCNGILVPQLPMTPVPPTLPPTTTTVAPTIPTTPPTTTTTTARPSLPPPVVYNPTCLCMLVPACSLGYIPISAVPSLDPRVVIGRQSGGSCGMPNSVCCRIMPDNPVTLPASTGLVLAGSGSSLVPNILPLGDVKNPGKYRPIDAIIRTDCLYHGATRPSTGTPNACTCLAPSQCPDGEAVTNDGLGAIDPRFGPCASSVLVCCRLTRRERADVAVPAALTCGTRDSTYANASENDDCQTLVDLCSDA